MATDPTTWPDATPAPLPALPAGVNVAPPFGMFDSCAPLDDDDPPTGQCARDCDCDCPAGACDCYTAEDEAAYLASLPPAPDVPEDVTAELGRRVVAVGGSRPGPDGRERWTEADPDWQVREAKGGR